MARSQPSKAKRKASDLDKTATKTPNIKEAVSAYICVLLRLLIERF